MRSTAEAIPGHRVIISRTFVAETLRNATATVETGKDGRPASPGQVAIALDEPWATRWGMKVIFVKPESLAPAPSYAALIKELNDTREVKDNLTAENAKLAKQLATMRTDRNLQRKLAEGRLEALVTEQDERSKLLQENRRLTEELESPLAQWERDLLGLPDLTRFVYPVESTTTPGKFYEISVLNNEVTNCTCLGFHFHGYCKHSDHFVIPAEAWEDARRYRARKDTAKRQDILRQIAALVKDYQ